MNRGVRCIVTNTQEGMFIILLSQHPTEAANTAILVLAPQGHPTTIFGKISVRKTI